MLFTCSLDESAWDSIVVQGSSNLVKKLDSMCYDQDVDFVVKYELPANFDILTKGNLCFHQVFEFKNHDVIVRFWEV